MHSLYLREAPALFPSLTCASLDFSELKASSRSKSSRDGWGSSRNEGGNTWRGEGASVTPMWMLGKMKVRQRHVKAVDIWPGLFEGKYKYISPPVTRYFMDVWPDFFDSKYWQMAILLFSLHGPLRSAPTIFIHMNRDIHILAKITMYTRMTTNLQHALTTKLSWFINNSQYGRFIWKTGWINKGMCGKVSIKGRVWKNEWAITVRGRVWKNE